jgi:hypothetical protein
MTLMNVRTLECWVPIAVGQNQTTWIPGIWTRSGFGVHLGVVESSIVNDIRDVGRCMTVSRGSWKYEDVIMPLCLPPSKDPYRDALLWACSYISECVDVSTVYNACKNVISSALVSTTH